jgi:hypothetical protein
MIYPDKCKTFNRSCPQGIPSGKKQEDMLDEVRKAAYLLHKSKSKQEAGEQEEEDDDNEGNSLPVVREDWEIWYPQEWIGWCMYGLPSEKPTEYWVHQPVSDGPTDVESYYTDPQGKRKIKKPPGRINQRATSDMIGSATKTLVDHNTLMAHHLVQMEKEMKVTVTAHNLKYINILIDTAVTEEEKEFSQWCYKSHMQIEIDALRDHFNEYNKSKGTISRTGTSVQPTTNFVATPSNDDNDMVQYHDDETNFEFTPMEEMYNALQGDSHASEFMQPSSYSGQFSPSEPHGEYDVVSEPITTALTEVYEGESVTSQMSQDSLRNQFTSGSNSSGIIQSVSSFAVEPTINRRRSGQTRPPLPPKKQSPVTV